jgi:hypothetical protein
MCNSHNHSPDCTCGFGGYGHLGKRSLYLTTANTSTSYEPYNHRAHNIQFQGSSEKSYRSFSNAFVNPNANCPVCGQLVFFCQLESGGRVFFDELGPPWEKHPCTDNTAHKTIATYTTTIIANKVHNKSLSYDSNEFPFRWQKEGWTPLSVSNAYIVHGTFTKIEGIFEGKELDLYIKNMEIPFKSIITLPIQLKNEGKNKFTLSTFATNGLRVFEKKYRAFNDLGVAHNASIKEKNTQRHRIQPSHFIVKKPSEIKKCNKNKKLKTKNAFELAFEKAGLLNKENEIKTPLITNKFDINKLTPMPNIINLFNKQPIATPPVKVPPTPLTFLADQVNKKKILETRRPTKATQELLQASADWNYREDWALTLLSAKKIGLDVEDVKRNHLVHLHDMGRAIAIAHILKQDQEAVDYFTNLITNITAEGLFYVNLGQILDQFKGYVWASDFTKIIHAGAYTEYQLWRIIDRPITRKTFY